MKKYFYTFFLCTLSFGAFAQMECEGAKETSSLYGNHVQAAIDASGCLFFDLQTQEAGYFIADDNNSTPETATIFAHGLWLSGVDVAGNLRTAAATYGKSSDEYDYYPGPLLEGGNGLAPENCDNWDKVWTVYRYQILAHLNDWEDNNQIDNPIPDIMAWPGKGNPDFEEWNGFPLTPFDDIDLASFVDQNENGIYEPLLGDVPNIKQAFSIPDQISWCVFNDLAGLHFETTGEPLSMEIQLTTWAYNCTDNDLLSKATFASYKLTNKGFEPIDSLYAGMWTDFDLGCFVDDYLGCSPEQNAYYAYNSTNFDDPDCTGGVSGFGTSPPVQTVKFLNKDLDHFFVYNANSAQDPVPAGTTPETPFEFRLNLTGLFRDGTPITEGGQGYQTGGPILDHMFPGNPTDPDAWAMNNENLTIGDRRSVGSTFLGELAPLESQIIDIAFTFHRDLSFTALQNVGLMYEEVPLFDLYYDEGFAGVCNQYDICTDDCVWAGDLNNDGIANHCDLLPLGFALDSIGNTRPGPYNWSPSDGFFWLFLQLNGENAKHLDANGNGVATGEDFLLTIQHYNFTRPGYENVDSYDEGDDIFMESVNPMFDLDQVEAGDAPWLSFKLTEEIPNLKGIAFSVEYDPQYIQEISPFTINSFDATNNLEFRRNIDASNQFDYARFLTDEEDSFFPNVATGIVRLQTQTDFEMPLPSATTQLRFKNIKAYLDDGTFVQLGGQTLDVTFVNVPVSTSEPAVLSDVQVYPNPVNDQLFIRSDNSGIDRVQLLSADGRLLDDQRSNTALTRLDMSPYAKGMYFLRLWHDNEWIYRKVIRQ
ncbi:MAG: T9SS type A sorting domain-containing protein [Saprospiraceae bacterium]|nr:T9SS type A sorting domain-containing protein [Saprospiraceae bacterium]